MCVPSSFCLPVPSCHVIQTSLWFREALATAFNVTEKLTPRNADRMCGAARTRATSAHAPL